MADRPDGSGRLRENGQAVGQGGHPDRPSIELVSCGETGWSYWDERTIAGLAELVRWHTPTPIPAATTTGPTCCLPTRLSAPCGFQAP